MDDSWKEEWVGMPEFVQEAKKPYSTIIVRLETEQDFILFSQLMDQKLTPKTKSIWFPFKSHWGGPDSKKRYVDES